MRVRMLRHGPSNGALELRRALGIRALRFEGSRFRPRAGDVVLNWGSSRDPVGGLVSWLNPPPGVSRAQNKLETLEALREADVPVPEFTTDMGTAQGWWAAGYTVMCRTLLRGSAGRGLVVLEGGQPMPDWAMPRAPLYTLYFKGSNEYRIHVVDGQVIDKQQKRLRNGIPEEERNFRVRNHDNGWVFCREDVLTTAEMDTAAVAAVQALGLDFGAVDLKANRQGDKFVVLEVNTAPGLEGTTLERYTEALGNLVRTMREAV